MMSSQAHAPAFGEADLTNCDRERIQYAAAIQPHGALLVLREPDWIVVQASANAADFLGLRASPVGRKLALVEPGLVPCLARALTQPLDVIPVALRCIGRKGPLDCLVHRPPEGGVILELEHVGPRRDVGAILEPALQTILAAPSLRSLCDETARLFKDVAGYDRVMVYRFDDDGHGEVFAEECEPHLEAYLGNWYPASDIPTLARKLYERNRVRVLVDVAAVSAPVAPRISPLSGKELDMSLCFLRSMSPIHIQYLRNMGVVATLVVSLMVGGKLWGLVACHHYQPRFVHFETRALCELLAEAVATRILALESFLQAQAELWVRRLEQRMVETVSRKGDWRIALFDGSQSLLQPLGASGAALLFEGTVMTEGDVPGTQQIRDIGAWLDQKPRAPIFATPSLSGEAAAFAPLTPVASGVIAVPISNAPGEYLLWFRPERIRTVTWGGNPFKPFEIGNDPTDLSPRRSFAQWHQMVEGTSAPWTQADLAAARLIGETVTDVVLQFRSLRMLIVQDQLETVRRQIQLSDQPVMIASPEGTVLASNQALERLLGDVHPRLQRVEDLLLYVADATDLRRRLLDLLKHHRGWRSEIRLEIEGSAASSLLLRADPVFAAPSRVLGFVLLFTDLSTQKAAEAARGLFQESLIQGHRLGLGSLEGPADLLFRSLFSSMIENAQLAAWEITDAVETAKIPELLANLRLSVQRAAETLAHLIRHETEFSEREN